MTDAELEDLSRTLGELLTRRGWTLASAESCTGGWLAKVVTDIAGSSQWFERGLVTYSNEAKQDLVGVSAATLNEHGAVSEATVQEMARGALSHSRADISVAISGVAGPGGGSADKPVGTVWFAWGRRDGRLLRLLSERRQLPGGRSEVRRRAVAHALAGLIELAGGDE
ncbi:MAG: nicotinamide-nucleotide amidase [Chromatiales bacterium]